MSPYREPAPTPEVRRVLQQTMGWLDNILADNILAPSTAGRLTEAERRLRNVEIAFVVLALLQVAELYLHAVRP